MRGPRQQSRAACQEFLLDLIAAFTCVWILSVAGLWPDTSAENRNAAGGASALLTPQFAEEVLKQQIPHVSKSYGMLTWLGGASNDPAHTNCCAPRWGDSANCDNQKLCGTILGDDVTGPSCKPQPLSPPQRIGAAAAADIGDVMGTLPANVGVGMGWLGQYMFILPDEDLVVVSLGESWGSSLQCDGSKGNGYDDAFSATQVWRAFRNYTIDSRADNLIQAAGDGSGKSAPPSVDVTKQRPTSTHLAEETQQQSSMPPIASRRAPTNITGAFPDNR